jgi:hypothetical protein
VTHDDDDDGTEEREIDRSAFFADMKNNHPNHPSKKLPVYITSIQVYLPP